MQERRHAASCCGRDCEILVPRMTCTWECRCRPPGSPSARLFFSLKSISEHVSTETADEGAAGGRQRDGHPPVSHVRVSSRSERDAGQSRSRGTLREAPGGVSSWNVDRGSIYEFAWHRPQAPIMEFLRGLRASRSAR